MQSSNKTIMAALSIAIILLFFGLLYQTVAVHNLSLDVARVGGLSQQGGSRVGQSYDLTNVSGTSTPTQMPSIFSGEIESVGNQSFVFKKESGEMVTVSVTAQTQLDIVQKFPPASTSSSQRPVSPPNPADIPEEYRVQKQTALALSDLPVGHKVYVVAVENADGSFGALNVIKALSDSASQ